jgi:hypothetical protein
VEGEKVGFGPEKENDVRFGSVLPNGRGKRSLFAFGFVAWHIHVNQINPNADDGGNRRR